MINNTDLLYFIETATTGHVSRAAERLGITQPALSHCLRRIEVQLDCQLFVRSKRGVTLTPQGRRLYENSQDLVRQWERVMTSVNDEATATKGLIRIGCHTAVAQYTLPAFLPKLLNENAGLEVQLHHGLSRHLTEQVVSSALDVTFAVNPSPHPDLIIKGICRDQVTLWKAKGCLNIDTLLLEPDLLQTQDLVRKLGKAGFSFKRKLESSSLEVLSQLLMSGAGLAILPERVIRAISDGKIEKIKDAPVYHDHISLVYKREFIRSKRGQVFVESVSRAFGR